MPEFQPSPVDYGPNSLLHDASYSQNYVPIVEKTDTKYSSTNSKDSSNNDSNNTNFLSIEFRGSSYNWFDLSNTDALYHSDFAEILAENVVTYFGVPLEEQFLMDENGYYY